MLTSCVAAEAPELEAGSDRLQRLRDCIRAIERRSPVPALPALGITPGAVVAGGDEATNHPWTLGEPAFDILIGAAGLEPGGLHEIKPAASRSSTCDAYAETGAETGAEAGAGKALDWMAVSAAARRFALALGVRWLSACDVLRREAPVLWCARAGDAAEFGAPYGAGLDRLGLDPARLIVVEPVKTGETLWAIEEGLKANGLALVLGQLPSIGLTPARRLALAAARGRTPCLLLTHPRAPPAAATATRWRIAPAPSASNPLDLQAPGASRFLVTLERCRGRPAAGQSVSLVLEWCDAALCFRLASGVAAGASRPGRGEVRSEHGCDGIPGRAAVAGS